jgi:hypothetical protein
MGQLLSAVIAIAGVVMWIFARRGERDSTNDKIPVTNK